MWKSATSVIAQQKISAIGVRAACLCGAVVLLVLSAKTKVPFYPVPMTLQTLALMIIGASLSWRMACAALTAYVLMGALGLPVFAGTPERGVGLVYLMGPTAGYILGFFPAIVLFSRISPASSLGRNALWLLLGLSVIYACGLLWLAVFLGRWNASLFALGFTPFIAADLFKAGIAWLAALGIRNNKLFAKLFARIKTL